MAENEVKLAVDKLGETQDLALAGLTKQMMDGNADRKKIAAQASSSTAGRLDFQRLAFLKIFDFFKNAETFFKDFKANVEKQVKALDQTAKFSAEMDNSLFLLKDLFDITTDLQGATFEVLQNIDKNVAKQFGMLTKAEMDRKRDRFDKTAQANLQEAGKDAENKKIDAAGTDDVVEDLKGPTIPLVAVIGGAFVAFIYGLDKFIRSTLLVKVTRDILKSEAFANLTKNLQRIFSPTRLIMQLENLFFFLDTRFQALNKFFQKVSTKGLFQIRKVLATVIDVLSRPFRLLKMGVDALKGPFDKILKFLQPVTNVFTNLFEVAKKTLGPILSILKLVFRPFLFYLFAFFDFVKGFFDGFRKTADDVRSFGERILDGIGEGLLEIVRGFVTYPLDLLKNGVAFIMDKLGFDQVADAMREFSFTELFNNMVSYLISKDGLLADISNFFTNGFNSFTAFMDEKAQQFTNFIDSIIQPIGQFFTDFNNFIDNLFSVQSNIVTNEIFPAIQAGLDKIGEIIDDVKSFFKDLFNMEKIKEKLKAVGEFDIVAFLFEKLKNAIEFIVKGIFGERIGGKILEKFGLDEKMENISAEALRQQGLSDEGIATAALSEATAKGGNTITINNVGSGNQTVNQSDSLAIKQNTQTAGASPTMFTRDQLNAMAG